MAEGLFSLDVCILFDRVEMIVQSYSHVVYTKLVDVSGAIMVELSGVMMCEVAPGVGWCGSTTNCEIQKIPFFT